MVKKGQSTHTKVAKRLRRLATKTKTLVQKSQKSDQCVDQLATTVLIDVEVKESTDQVGKHNQPITGNQGKVSQDVHVKIKTKSRETIKQGTKSQTKIVRKTVSKDTAKSGSKLRSRRTTKTR